jgi:hypothetical protein
VATRHSGMLPGCVPLHSLHSHSIMLPHLDASARIMWPGSLSYVSKNQGKWSCTIWRLACMIEKTQVGGATWHACKSWQDSCHGTTIAGMHFQMLINLL